jgi:CCR4-NOT transcription complex subunit 1
VPCLFRFVAIYLCTFCLLIGLLVQVIYSDEEKKFNLEIVIGLISYDLLNLGEYNAHLAKLIDGGRNSKSKQNLFLLYVEFKNENKNTLHNE